jgi:methyl-accepting chemotaxis protein
MTQFRRKNKTPMKLNRNLAALPVIAVILFGIGLAAMVYVNMGSIKNLNAKVGAHHALLSQLGTLAQDIEGLGDDLLAAPGSEGRGLESLALKAKRVRDQLTALGKVPENKVLAARLTEEFDIWYRPAMQARLMHALEPGDRDAAIIVFEEHYKILQDDLQQARLETLQQFAESAASSYGGSSRAVLIVLAAALLLIGAFGGTVWQAVHASRARARTWMPSRPAYSQGQQHVLDELKVLRHNLDAAVDQVRAAGPGRK